MILMNPSAYEERWESDPPFQIHITSYKLDGTYFCSVDNVDPGAVIARSKAGTREEAERRATAQAKKRLDHSRAALKTSTLKT